jgi:hypothetical protein
LPQDTADRATYRLSHSIGAAVETAFTLKLQWEYPNCDATGTNAMAETVTVDRPPVAKAAATVSASALALHLDCTRTYIGKLEADPAAR